MKLKSQLKYRIHLLWEHIKFAIDCRLYRFPEMTNNDPLKDKRPKADIFGRDANGDYEASAPLSIIEGWWCVTRPNGDHLRIVIATTGNWRIDKTATPVWCMCKTPAHAIDQRNCVRCGLKHRVQVIA